MGLRELVPETFDLNRCVVFAGATEHVDHLTVTADDGLPAKERHALEDRAERRTKPRGVRPAVHHELLEHLLRIENHYRPGFDQGRDTKVPRNELCTNALAMVSRRDDERGLARREPVGKKVRHRLAKPLVVAIELHGMVSRIAWKNCSSLHSENMPRSENYGSSSR